MISIVSICHDRQYCLDEVLPSWLAQEGIEFEIVIVAGPTIKRIDHPKVTYVDWPTKELTGVCVAWNVGYKAAKYDIIYSCYSDMVLQDKRYIARFLAHYGPNRIVNRQMIRADGSLDEGIWCYGFLVGKDLIAKSGGWDERYDGGYAWEDGHMMHSLVNAGGELSILKVAPKGRELRHVDHPCCRDAADWTEKYVRNKRIYNKSFPNITLMDMYRKGRFKVYEDTDTD